MIRPGAVALHRPAELGLRERRDLGFDTHASQDGTHHDAVAIAL
jgi:hypothetical protein